MRYHSVMSILRPLQRSITIDEIQLYGYDGPASKRDAVEPEMGVLVRLIGNIGGTRVEGIAETAVKSAQRDVFWQYLCEAGAHFSGLRIPQRGSVMSRVKKELHRLDIDSELLVAYRPTAELIETAVRNLSHRAPHAENSTFTTLAQQREPQKWPRVLTPGPTGHLTVDFPAMSAVVALFAVFPEADEPYRGTRNNFADFRLPGAAKGLGKQGNLQVEALKRGMSIHQYDRQYFLAERDQDSPSIGFTGADSSQVSVSSIAVVQDKSVAKIVLDSAGLPVPEGIIISASEDRTELEAKVQKLTFPVVVKPANGRQGYGVTANIDSMDELHQAVKRAYDDDGRSDRIIVERHVKGTDYRLFSTDEKTLCVMQRHRAAVTGNGRHSIQELIAWASAIRRGYPNLARLNFNFATLTSLLAHQGYDLDTIPSPGEKVYLARADSISQGGVSSELLEETHPSILDIGVKAVRATGLPFAGIDLFLEDHRRSIDEQEAHILEVNNYPGTEGHRYPMYGAGVNVFAEMVEQSARKAGLELPQPQETMTVRMSVHGQVQAVGYRVWMRRTALAIGLDGWVRNRDTGEVEAVVSGPVDRIVSLYRLAFKGPRNANPDRVFATPVSDEVEPGFHIR